MTYYRVKPENDGRRIGNGLFAIAHELFTTKEAEKLNAIRYCEIVEISRSTEKSRKNMNVKN